MGLDFRVFSIAKREEVVYTDEGEEVKTVNHPQLFRFFTSLRDEAHRFALSYGRKARNMAMTASLLEGIKGIGSKRKGLLEKLYPDLKELARVTPEELSRIGIPRKVAEEVVRRAKELEFNQVLQELPPASEGNLGER
jgi:excinuclease ABC subunit C